VTVSSKGKNLRPSITGVVTDTRPVHPDHRGRLFEIYRGEDDLIFKDPIRWIYSWSIRSGSVKGWGKHEKIIDRYVLISGEVSVVLWDSREDSETFNQVQIVQMSHQSTQMLLIPAGVWHLTYNPSQEESYLLNFKTEPFNHESPDKQLLPWNTKEIPFDVAAFISGTNLSAL
tara:strand:+ start:686 stop:1204 length:519 start_codon:yes stop_codon:yes gene_type:complete